MRAAGLAAIPSLLELAVAHGAQVIFQPIRIQKEDLTAKSRASFPAREEIRRAMKLLLREKARGGAVASSAAYLRHMFDTWPECAPRTGCWAGRLYCFLTPDGYATACCDTLRLAPGDPLAYVPRRGAAAFGRIPTYRCASCSSSVPLEINLAMHDLARHPLRVARESLATLSRRRQGRSDGAAGPVPHLDG